MLINGYAASKEDWDPVFLEALAIHSALLCPDNRGIGGSAGPVEGLSVAAMARDVRSMLDERGVATADIAGWSMGGFVAQELAATAPERVRHLVLLSTDPGGSEAVRAEPDVWARLTDHGGSPREQATRLIGLLFPPPVAARVDAEFGETVAKARALLAEATLSAQEAAMEAWHASPARPPPAAITAAYVAAGAADIVIPPVNSERLAEMLGHAELELYDGGGHAFMAQEPQRLAAAIGAHLGR